MLHNEQFTNKLHVSMWNLENLFLKLNVNKTYDLWKLPKPNCLLNDDPKFAIPKTFVVDYLHQHWNSSKEIIEC
jgi:hypothetical protein